MDGTFCIAGAGPYRASEGPDARRDAAARGGGAACGREEACLGQASNPPLRISVRYSILEFAHSLFCGSDVAGL